MVTINKKSWTTSLCGALIPGPYRVYPVHFSNHDTFFLFPTCPHYFRKKPEERASCQKRRERFSTSALNLCVFCSNRTSNC